MHHADPVADPAPDRPAAPPRPAPVPTTLRAPSALAQARQWLIEALYPPACINCRAEVETAHALCPECWRDTVFTGAPVCDRCGAPTIGREDAPICEACLHQSPRFSRGRAAVLYEGIGRKLTLALKHGDRLDIARPAAIWMQRAGRPLIDSADLIAPAPLHWTRLLKRRCNQSAVLAREVARLAGRREALVPDLLTRTRATGNQGGRSREGRHANLIGAFAVTPRWRKRVRGARVLVIDDVMTSGATMSACADALRAAGARDVNALCLARVAPEQDGPIFAGRDDSAPTSTPAPSDRRRAEADS